jgi:hypothetical protein
MNREQLIAMWLGIAVIVVMGLYCTTGQYHFILDPMGSIGVCHPELPPIVTSSAIRIDFPLLVVQWAMVAIITGGLIITFADKKDNMNWKRGFRRIVFVLVVAAAIVCAGLSVALILTTHSDAQFNLQWKQQEYAEQHLPFETLPDGFYIELDAKAVSKLKAKGFSDKEIEDFQKNLTANKKAEQIAAKKELSEEKKSFWIRLSKGGLVGLCGVGGLIGGIIGFVIVWFLVFIVWFLYKLFEWIVLGFANDKPKDEQKQ